MNRNSTIIDIEGVDVAEGGKRILRGVCWRIAVHQNWAVIGGNGAGKSTLLRLLRREVWPEPGCAGKVRYNLDGAGLTESGAGVRQGIVTISPEAQEAYDRNGWDMPVIEAVCTGFTDTVWYQGKIKDSERALAESVIEALRLRGLASKTTLELSQGQMRKVLLARALVARPKCIVLDEFCNGLDISSRNELLRMIDLVASLGVQIVFTTHREEEIGSSITHVAFLRNGAIVAQGRREDVLNEENWREAFGGCGWHSEGAGSRALNLGADEVLVGMQRASVYLDGMRILQGLDWEIRKNQNWAVLGENGAGKSTLLKLLLGDLSPAQGGAITRFGFNEPFNLWDVKRRIGFVSAEFQGQYDQTATGREIVLSGFFASVGLYETPTAEQEVRARELIQSFGLEGLQNRRLDCMSYGQARKFLLARALVNNPELLILDEACDGLDIPSRREVLRLVQSLIETTPMRVVMVTHHIDELVPAISHVLVLREGRIADSGTREKVLREEHPRAAFSGRGGGDAEARERLRGLFV